MEVKREFHLPRVRRAEIGQAVLTRVATIKALASALGTRAFADLGHWKRLRVTCIDRPCIDRRQVSRRCRSGLPTRKQCKHHPPDIPVFLKDAI